MLSRTFTYIKNKERSWRSSFGNDISTPEKRRAARIHLNWIDHGILRIWWTNFFEVSDGVYRSNQPSPERLEAYKAQGIKTVLNLRGAGVHSQYLFEKEACDTLGLTLVDIKSSARRAPDKHVLLELAALFQTIEKPFVMHCKSGADRAGLVSALYLMLEENVPVETARDQLGLKYAHLKFSSTGILDYFLETYRRANEGSPIGFLEWVETVYDADDLTAAYKSGGKR